MFEREDLGAQSPVRCWCGQASTELDLVVVESGPRVTVRGLCREHAQVDSEGLESSSTMTVAGDAAIDQLVRFGGTPWWADLESAAATIVLAVAEIPIPILVLDPGGEAVAVNHAWSEVTGLSSSASSGRRWLSAITGASSSMLDQIVSPKGLPQLFVGLQRFAQPYLSGLLSTRPLIDRDGAAIGHIVFFAGLGGIEAPVEAGGWNTEHRALDQARAEVAWAGLLRRVDEALERHRGLATTMAALMIDLEHVVDADEIAEPLLDSQPLSVVEGRIKDVLSSTDSVMALGRRFAIVSEQVLGYEPVARMAQRLIDVIAEPIGIEGRDWYLRASVGVAFPHLPADTATGLVAKAERATQLAQTLGGQRFEVVIGTGPGSSDIAEPENQRRQDAPDESPAPAAAGSGPAAMAEVNGPGRRPDRR
jgi:GGDEF domain-containing protein